MCFNCWLMGGRGGLVGRPGYTTWQIWPPDSKSWLWGDQPPLQALSPCLWRPRPAVGCLLTRLSLRCFPALASCESGILSCACLKLSPVLVPALHPNPASSMFSFLQWANKTFVSFLPYTPSHLVDMWSRSWQYIWTTKSNLCLLIF